MLQFLRRAFVTIFFLTLVMISSFFLLILYLKSQPLPPSIIEETTILYSIEGDVIDTLHGGINRQIISLDNIPSYIQKATIATEDRGFYSHFGFDPKRTTMAVITNLKDGRKAQGGSTITQQLARNLYLSHEKTWERKIKELIYSLHLELNYSKDEILEMYLNQIYYGNSAYGIQSAALTYFGKSADELSLAEGALLVGIPKGPTYYEPYRNWDRAKKRQKVVLQSMVENGVISQREADDAYNEELHIIPKEEKARLSAAPYFRDEIFRWVKSQYGMNQEELAHAGLKIYTSLSLDMQKSAEMIIEKTLPENSTETDFRPIQAALVAMEPNTGYIRAMVGGRDYQQSQYNRAYAERQPGSSFKPFLYLTALEQGMTPLTEIESKPTVFEYDNKLYMPKNFGEKYPNGYITMMEAIRKSDNIYAVSTHMALGTEQLVERAKELGISSDLQPLPSLALGSQPMSPVAMVKGYGILANLGERVEPTLVLKIVDRRGKVLYEHTPTREKVADPRQVFILNHMLQGVFDEGGTAHRVVSLLKRPVAGKTGTTDHDAWMIGFTPKLVTSVWVGYDENKPLSIVEAHYAAPIWAEFMEAALEEQPPMLFPVPEGLTSVYIDLSTRQLATSACPTSQLVYFMPGTEPQDYCSQHGTDPGVEPLPPVEEKKSLWERLNQWWKD